MTIYTVLLSDGTVGTVNADTLDFMSPVEWIGSCITVHLHDENGNGIRVDGIMEELLSTDP